MKIGYKLILALTGLLLPLTVGYFVILFNHQKAYLDTIVLEEILFIENTFRNIKERDTVLLSSTLEAVVNDPSFGEVYLQGNRRKLYEFGQPLFRRLKKNYGITHFYFIRPDGRTFVRLHNRDIYDDLVTRHTFRKARDSGGMASGIELGKTTFALRAVSPYYHEGRLIGFVELGEEIEHFLQILKGESNNEFAFVADKKHVDGEKWRAARQAAGLRDNWDDLQDHLMMAATTRGDTASACFTRENLEKIEEGQKSIGRIRGTQGTFACGGFEIRDAGGQHAGAVLALIDITEHASMARRFTQMTSMLIVAAFGVVFVVGVLLSRAVARRISKLQQASDEIASGNFDQTVPVTTNDELGQLARAFNEMTRKLKVTYTNLQHQIEERKKLEATLRTLSMQDGLTGLANRRRFNRTYRAEWNRALRDGSELSIILIDIDYFKDYNDTYGHLAGDDCLRAVSAALKHHVKRPGDLVARYGGEEFVALLPSTSLKDAFLMAESMRKTVQGLSLPHRSSGITDYVTISAGVSSVVPTRGMPLAVLLKHADRALYQAKLEGRNRTVKMKVEGQEAF